jgi:hypothetical protein
MSETWESVQIAVLQKMGLITGNTLIKNTTTLPAINAMPPVANRGLQLLSTAGKYITKDIEITQNPIDNIMSQPLYKMNVYSYPKEIIPCEAVGAKAYYFEVDNTATIDILVDGVVVETINNTVKGKFTAYKKNIPNPDGKTVKIDFKGLYPYQYTNIALYGVAFETDSDVWEYVSEHRYDMKSLVPDFYKLKDIIYQSGFNEVRYEKTANYQKEGDSVIVLGGLNKGRWKVFYYAYPQTITKTTPDSTPLSLDPEVAALLSTYIASELMMEDDPALAVQFRNEFEVARGELRPSETSGTVVFLSESGW